MERNENTSISSGVTDTNAISPRCNQGAFDGGATYRSRFVQSEPSSRHATREVSKQQQQHSLCVYMPVATAEKYSRLIQICASIWTATLAVINVRHAAGHSPDGQTWSDTHGHAVDQNRSPAMFVIAGLRGNGIWIRTKEPCSAEDHRNPSVRHRNDAGSSLVLTKTPCSRHR